MSCTDARFSVHQGGGAHDDDDRLPAGRLPERDATAECSVGRCRPGKRRFWSRTTICATGVRDTAARRRSVLRGAPGCRASKNRARAHWALTTFEHVHHASRHPEIFSSVPPAPRWPRSTPPSPSSARSIINLDDPGISAAAVDREPGNRTPKMVARIEDSVRIRAQRLVADMIATIPTGPPIPRRGRLPARCRCRSSGDAWHPEGGRGQRSSPLDGGPVWAPATKRWHTTATRSSRSSSISPPTASSSAESGGRIRPLMT